MVGEAVSGTALFGVDEVEELEGMLSDILQV